MDLGSLLGGLADDGSQGQGGSGQDDAMADLLGALLGGAQGGAPNQSGEEVLGSLGSINNAPMLGDSSQGGMSASGADLGGLLGGLLGGQSAQGGDMMGMLGGLLGGMGGAPSNASGTNTGMNAALAPLADLLADKLGLPRDMAMTALAIVVPMIMNKLASGNAAQGLSFSRDEQNEMIGSLTQQTGMSEQDAAATLNQAVQVLGSQ